jgi:PAS domain S-box-containing protein
MFSTYEPGMEHSVSLARRPLYSDHLPEMAEALPMYQRLAEVFDIRQVMLLPLAAGDHALGEIAAINKRAGRFTAEDRRTFQAVAAQIAAALDRVRLYRTTGQNLTRRLQELDSIARVSNELAQTTDFDRALDVIRLEAVRATEASGNTVALLAASSDPSAISLNRRLGDAKLGDVLAPIERAAIEQAQAAIALNEVPRPIDETDPNIDLAALRGVVLVEDYAESAYASAPRGARSAIAAAFTYENRVVGVFHLYHEQPHHFDQRAAAFLLTLAAKASLSYGTSLQHLESQDRSERLRRRVEQLSQIFELGQMLQTSIDPNTILEAIAYSISQSCGFDQVLVALRDESLEEAHLLHAAQVGLLPESANARKGRRARVNDVQALFGMQPFHISESLFLPIERMREWYNDAVDLFSLRDSSGRTLTPPRTAQDWRDGDLLLVPIIGAGGQLVGAISLDRPGDGRRPDRSTVEILEIFAHQAAAMLENTRLYMETLRGQEVEAQLNQVMEAIASTLDLNHIVESVARGALRLLPFNTMTMALVNSDQSDFDLIQVTIQRDGSLAIGRDRTASLAGTAMGRTFETAADYLYHFDGERPEYADLAAWQAENERTTLIVPMISGGLCLGALHLGSTLRDAFGFDEYRDLLKRVANLTTVAVQNARLFQQAVNLRLFNESVFQSIQQGLIVLDRAGHILSANDYIRRRFEWGDDVAGKRLFEALPALRGALENPIAVIVDTLEPQQVNEIDLLVNDRPLRFNVALYPLQTSENARGIVVLFDDVTERTRLERDVAARSYQLDALTEVSSRITATLSRAEVIELALDEMQRVIGYDTMTLWRRMGEELVMEAARGMALIGDEIRVSIRESARLRQLIELQRALSLSGSATTSLPGSTMGSWLGLPLVRQGEVIGMITLSKTEKNFYDASSERAAQAFANQVAVALANAQLFEESAARTQRLSLINRVSMAMAQSLDTENILEVALREIAEALGFPYGIGYLYERDTNVARAVVEYPRGDFPPAHIIDLYKDPLFNRLNRSTVPLVVEDRLLVEDDDMRLALEARNARGYVLLPMAIGRQPNGVFEFMLRDQPYIADQERIDLVMLIANQAAIAALNSNLLEQTLVRTRELETLLEAAQATSMSLDLNEVFQSVVRLTMQAIDVDDCAIMLYDNVEDVLFVELDLNRNMDASRIMEPGTVIELSAFPARRTALLENHIMVVRRDDQSADAHEIEDMLTRGDTARMLVPLVVRDQPIGMLQIDLQSSYRTFTHREIRMAQALAAQAATAIENARLTTETSAQVEQSLVLNEISRAISATMDVSEMIGIVRDQVPALLTSEEMYLALYDAGTGTIAFPMAVREGYSFEMMPRQLGSDEVSWVIRNRRPLLLGGDNPGADEVRRNLGIVDGEGGARRYLGVPLIAGEQVVGVLALRDKAITRPFGLNEQRILTSIATQLGATIQNVNLFARVQTFADELNQRVRERTQELQQERDRLDALYRISSELGRSLDIDRVLARALDMTARAVNAEDGAVLLVDEQTGQLYTRASLEGPPPEEDETREIRLFAAHPAERIARWLLEQNTPIARIPDLRAASYWDHRAEGAAAWRSAVAVRLEMTNNRQGALIFLSREYDNFNDPQIKLVSAAATQLTSSMNNADLYTLVRDQAQRLADLLRMEQEEAEKNSAILEGIADGVMLADADSRIVLYNSAAERILGLPRDVTIGQRLPDLATPDGAYNTGWAGPLQHWIEQSRRAPDDSLLLERLLLGNRVINVQATPVYNGEQFLGTVALFRDITRDVEVDRMKSEFISNVSHELRTPMTSIKGYVDLMLMGAAGQVNETQSRFLNTIKNNADRLAVLVNDLLNISKIDSGEETLELEAVGIAGVVEQALNALREQPHIERKGLHIAVDIPADLPAIRADRSKVLQIVRNLIDNAFNYTNPGGHVAIGAHLEAGGIDSARPGAVMVLRVQDDGIGIPESFQPRVYDRFERYDEHALVMEVAGTGLGLSIVRHLVELHGGEVWFESQEDVGTTFYVALPVNGPVRDGSGRAYDNGTTTDTIVPQSQIEAGD